MIFLFFIYLGIFCYVGKLKRPENQGIVNFYLGIINKQKIFRQTQF